MARIELWNGDICELEVDAIVNPANLSLWMSTGVSGAIKRAGGDAIEFAAVRQAPVPLGEAIVTPAGSLAAKAVIHAVSLDRDRRTSGAVIEAAVRSAMARAREIGATSIAFPALGTGVGGFPLDDAARITVETVRDPDLDVVQQSEPRRLSTAVSPSTADQLTQMMVGVVQNGSGTSAQIPGVQVAGKTGTAENNPDLAPHAWFTSFAPADDPRVAVAVIVENGGSSGSEATGGAVAAPIARAVMEAVLNG